jgi:D-alanyl-lipoteichoic acid acyltransferase DltB (MBOAT superfamily)
MLFNSIDFVVFFALVFALFWSIPQKFRWVLLLAASYFFYMSWEPAYLLLILFSTTVDYFVCLNLTSSKEEKKRKLGLFLSIGLNLSMLLFFKYATFLLKSIHQLCASVGVEYKTPAFEFLLPVGISFYTFQAISYAVDVYRGTLPAERHFGKFALFISFFPQLVAGPIERAKELLPQFSKSTNTFRTNEFKDGVLLFFWGLFKKAVVADNVAMFVDTYYGTYQYQSGGFLLFATYLFAIQIYCDFSGYSDMAVGIAKMLGFRLMENFRSPYFSESLTAFWRNWHISLSTWFKDYVYIPLGGNRGGKARTTRNTLITMGVAGFWHGANWTFLFWGFWNGFLLAIEKMFEWKEAKSSIWRWIKILLVFHLVCIGWVFFRSENLQQAFDILQKIVFVKWEDFYFVVADNRYSIAVLSSAVLFLIEIQFVGKSILVFRTNIKFYRYFFYVLLVILVLFWGSSTGKQFIYFQF